MVGGGVYVPLCEGASLPGLLANLQFGVLSETGNILPSQLQRGGWKRDQPRGGPALQTWESHGKSQRCQPTQDSPPSCPHPVLQMRWPPGPSAPSCSPGGWEPCLPWPRAPRPPLDPRACDDEMAAWAASHEDGFQALKWAERDERPREGHFFLNFGARRTRCPALSQHAGFCALVSRHRRGTYCSHQQRARRGRTQGWGRAGGVAGNFLGVSPEGAAQPGAQGKSPRLTGDSL